MGLIRSVAHDLMAAGKSKSNGYDAPKGKDREPTDAEIEANHGGSKGDACHDLTGNACLDGRISHLYKLYSFLPSFLPGMLASDCSSMEWVCWVGMGLTLSAVTLELFVCYVLRRSKNPISLQSCANSLGWFIMGVIADLDSTTAADDLSSAQCNIRQWNSVYNMSIFLIFILISMGVNWPYAYSMSADTTPDELYHTRAFRAMMQVVTIYLFFAFVLVLINSLLKSWLCPPSELGGTCASWGRTTWGFVPFVIIFGAVHFIKTVTYKAIPYLFKKYPEAMADYPLTLEMIVKMEEAGMSVSAEQRMAADENGSAVVENV